MPRHRCSLSPSTLYVRPCVGRQRPGYPRVASPAPATLTLRCALCSAYLWFFKIARLRLDPTAYSALRAGPEDAPGASPTVQ